MISDRFEVSDKNIDLDGKEDSVKNLSQRVGDNRIENDASFGIEFLGSRRPKTSRPPDESHIKSEFNFLKLQLEAMKKAILKQNEKQMQLIKKLRE